MISFDDATAIIWSAARPLCTEIVPIERAAGRVLALPVIAAIDSPRADVSAMDGYAVRSADLATFPVSLAVVGESFPGAQCSGMVSSGTCFRIFTGAPIPPGANRIVIQEQVRREGRHAIIEADPGPAVWVRPRARDFRAGDEVLSAGRQLDPAALIAAAGADCAEVEVAKRPRLAHLSTGDELVQPGTARHSPLCVPDSVSLGATSLAEEWGATVVDRARVGDNLARLTAAARHMAQTADVVVVTGGASVGERDFAKTVFEPLGFELLFSGVAMRPGKPAWFARSSEKLVLGLPGNPTSALVTARLLLAPLLTKMQGGPLEAALGWEPARILSQLPACDARETFHRAQLSGGAASLVGFQESHAQKALADADVLVRQRPDSAPVHAGEIVEVLRL